MRIFGLAALALFAIMGLAALLGYAEADHDEREADETRRKYDRP
mgnify:CR=1 FL=1